MDRLRISEVMEGSIAWEAGIEPGDYLVSMNRENINDIFDYRFLMAEEELCLKIQKANGSILEVDIEKDEQEDIGLLFDKPLLDEEKCCQNHCVFCFIDQLPPGMRESLYYKDDDARLSFLFGNYITMTNMNKDELNRIIRYRMSPVNVSVHTTNPDLRVLMLKNRHAGDILSKMKLLAVHGITLNAQIVLCRGINDGEELDKTMDDLSGLIPELNSISIVPVGLTRFREKLPVLKAYDRKSALSVIQQVERWQNEFLYKTGRRRVFLSDEWYLMSGVNIPGYEYYEEFPQIENGVGMIAALEHEFQQALHKEKKHPIERTISLATGTLVYPVILKLVKQVTDCFSGLKVFVYPIENYFFGNTVTVAGLITGTDVQTQLQGKPLGEKLLLSDSMFRKGTEIFLDDMTIKNLSHILQTKVEKVGCAGDLLLKALLY